MEKKTRAYESPKVEVLGSVAELTQGHVMGNSLDASFLGGTQFKALTFSN
jgi:hypothetical protein